LLEALGLDACEHLASVRDEYQGMDCADISVRPSGGKLTQLLMQCPEQRTADIPASVAAANNWSPTLTLSQAASWPPKFSAVTRQDEYSSCAVDRADLKPPPEAGVPDSGTTLAVSTAAVSEKMRLVVLQLRCMTQKPYHN
jgi:hypothetical protein